MTPIAQLITNVQQVIRQAPQATIERSYVKAARELTMQSRCWRVTLDAQTAADTQIYSLGQDPNSEIMAIGWGQLGTPPSVGTLYVSTSETWNRNAPPSKPYQMAFFPPDQVGFWPVPDKAYDVRLVLLVAVRLDADELPELIARWHQALTAGALMDLYGMDGQSWADPNRAAQQGRILQAGIANARAWAARSYQDGIMRARPRPFVIGGRFR